MRAKLTLLSALVLGTFAGVLAAGCQTYDFEPVEPLALSQTTVEETITARSRKPNIMLLVDTSGSMTDPVNPADPDCRVTVNGQPGTCGGPDVPCNTSICPTRWTELQAAVPQFLASSGRFARFGLTTYPTGNEPNTSIACAAPTGAGDVDLDLPNTESDDALLAHSNDINARIQAIPNSGTGMPAGGTPTSGSLNFVGNLASLQSQDREDFVILLTDGLPNCNKDNINDGSNPDLCKCTLLPATQCSGSFSRRGCLDMDASVAAVNALKAKGIKTIVIGFGAETATGNGPMVLDAMAKAGGFARTCTPGQTSCGPNDSCDVNTQLCSRSFYQAGNQQELAAALAQIGSAVINPEPCLIKLDPSQMPSDPKLVVAYVDGERQTAGDGTWTLTDNGVLFNGATCDRIKASTPSSPVNIEVRAIRQR